ncbi:phage holin family protein [Pseudarthrobacter sp. PS3-L1]|uniref:phage holin family protein n=1 Tax=Pseudarthrobacter sp. PS3-L1 TaxID=3046207 RepID=UPI0024BB8FA5|nr:phage holin family protein [Pseudarthrobacter sp. PS3-L1]MDJ0319755.1 phage holin family protein [Pseudarthrobacter sp. PS3-L1]
MSGRHSGRENRGLRITALPGTFRLIMRLAPRQLHDEIAFAKIELKRKGVQLGVAAAFFVVALVFVLLLVIGLVVAAIMGLATLMPAWLAALLVSALFLVLAGVGALIGYVKLKKALPLVPEETLRGIKHDLGIAQKGSEYDPALLDPSSAAAKAAKKAKDEAKAKAKAEKEAKDKEQDSGLKLPVATGPELGRRLTQRREHLTEVRDDLGEELDVKAQAEIAVAAAKRGLAKGQVVLDDGKDRVVGVLADVAGPDSELRARWKPLSALVASASVLVVLIRRLIKSS